MLHKHVKVEENKDTQIEVPQICLYSHQTDNHAPIWQKDDVRKYMKMNFHFVVNDLWLNLTEEINLSLVITLLK